METISQYELRYLTPELIKGLTVVGISGEAGSGKSTIAKHLVRTYGFTPTSFANPFKLDAVVQEGLPISEVFGSYKSPPVRKWLQERGVDFGREIAGLDVWIYYLEANLYYLIDHGVDKVVVADVRFFNEIAAINALGGSVYRLCGRGGETGEESAHQSERELDGFSGFSGFLYNGEGNEERVFDDLRVALFLDFNITPL